MNINSFDHLNIRVAAFSIIIPEFLGSNLDLVRHVLHVTNFNLICKKELNISKLSLVASD